MDEPPAPDDHPQHQADPEVVQMTRIVCGVDGSRGAQRALAVAAAIGEELHGELTAVNVVADVPDGGRPYETAVRLSVRHAVEHAERQLESALQRVERAEGTRLRVEQGSAADRLAAVADESGASLLVVGARGLGRLKTALLGSVSRRLAGRTPCPLLVVSEGTALPLRASDSEGDAWKEAAITVGVDDSEHARTAAQVAGRLASRLGRRLVLVHADSSGAPSRAPSGARYPWGSPSGRPAGADTLLRARGVAPPGVSVEVVLERGSVERALVRATARRDCELIVVGSRGLSPLRAALWGSVSMRLAASSPRPVVIVPRNADPAAFLPDVEDAAA